MGGEKEGNPEAKTLDYPVRFVIVATDSLIKFNQRICGDSSQATKMNLK